MARVGGEQHLRTRRPGYCALSAFRPWGVVAVVVVGVILYVCGVLQYVVVCVVIVVTVVVTVKSVCGSTLVLV